MADVFISLKNMIYSGRGIIVGKNSSGRAFVGYTLTGRSPSSQARELLQGENTGTIRVAGITDEKRLREMFKITNDAQLAKLQEDLKKGSPALIYYPAIVPVDERTLVASNGAQTKLLYNTAVSQSDHLLPGPLIDRAFRYPVWEYDQQDDRWIDITTYEPDAPNNTPRISAVVRGDEAALHIASDKRSETYETRFDKPQIFKPGHSILITTYSGGNEKPLVPFQGSPLRREIDSGSAQDIAESLYEAIHGGQKPGENYRVACAVVMVKPSGLETAIINRVDRGS